MEIINKLLDKLNMLLDYKKAIHRINTLELKVEVLEDKKIKLLLENDKLKDENGRLKRKLKGE